MDRNDRFFTIAFCCALALTAGGFVWDRWNAYSATMPRAEARRVADVSRTGPVAEAPPTDVSPATQRPAASSGLQLASSSARNHPTDVQPAVDREGPDPAHVRTFVATLVGLAAGEVPVGLAQTLPTMAEILVRRDADGRLVPAAGTRARYRDPVNAVMAIDGTQLAAHCRRHEAELAALVEATGSGHDSIDAVLGAAIDHLLEVELPEAEPDMVSAGSQWDFADADHRALSDAQKHMLLMGRSNARRLRAKLLELREAFGLQEAPRAVAPVIADATGVDRSSRNAVAAIPGSCASGQSEP